MASGYTAFRWFIKNIIVRLFFRQVDVIGTFRVPKSGPVIFVANHSNQFVDPLMLISNTNRVVRFLTAAKSMRRRIIGDMARMAKAIGVERPQDLAKKGSGKISVSQKAVEVVTGVGSAFSEELQEGYKIKVGDTEVTVKSVVSDVCCTTTPWPDAISDTSYTVLPKVDQGAVYTKVHDALKSGDCIGIFPEGGSHDQTTLLDLKPGVAIMALGAMEAGAGTVKICPCGLNYFEPYKFRSRVVVEFGTPFEVPTELAQLYRTDKRAAGAKLMQMVEGAMEGVKLGAKDFAELQAIITMRALYKPRDRVLSPEETQKINKSFQFGVQACGDDPRIQEAVQLVEDYNGRLRAAGCTDRDVRENLMPTWRMVLRGTASLVQAVLLFVPAMVCFALFAPVATASYILAKREMATALAGSTVKVKALDVVASYKIIVCLVLVPMYNLFLTIVATNLLRMHVWSQTNMWLIGVTVYFVGLPFLIYTGCLLCDHFVRVCAECRTVSLRACGSTQSMLEVRTQLQLKIRALVEELGPKYVKDFEEKRVIKQADISADTNDLLRKGLVGNGLKVPLLAKNGK